MAAMINAEELRALKAKHPKAKVVCYVNTTAEVKAECDVCCTSANAASIVEKIAADEIIFVPDKYLAANIKTSKKIIPWQGFCPTHLKIIPGHLKKLKLKYPKALVVTHPECTPDVNRFSDAVLSTSQMLRFIKNSSAKTFIIGTEIGIIHRMQKENPDKKFIPASELCVCPNMKMTTLESVYEALRDMKNEVNLGKNVIKRAKSAITLMM